MSTASATLYATSMRLVLKPSSTDVASIRPENTVSNSGTPDDVVGRPVFEYEEYHPFGSTSWHAQKSGIQVSRKRYRYTGKEKDDETGLIYIGARYYAGWLGRWTAADPSGGHRYAYCSNRPIVMHDPDGREERGALGLGAPPVYGAAQGLNRPRTDFGPAPSLTGLKLGSAMAGARIAPEQSLAQLSESQLRAANGHSVSADVGPSYPAPFMDPTSVSLRLLTSAGPVGVAGAAAGALGAYAGGNDIATGIGIGAAIGGLADPAAVAVAQGGTNRQIASGPAQRTQTQPTPEPSPAKGKPSDPATGTAGTPASEGFEVTTRGALVRRDPAPVLEAGQTYRAYIEGASGVIGSLDSSGMLSLQIKLGINTPTGGQMFEEAVAAFGVANIRGIRGRWMGSGDLTDNFDAFQKAKLDKLTPEQAAFKTFTGHMAETYGFTNAKVTRDEAEQVVVEFTR